MVRGTAPSSDMLFRARRVIRSELPCLPGHSAAALVLVPGHPHFHGVIGLADGRDLAGQVVHPVFQPVEFDEQYRPGFPGIPTVKGVLDGDEHVVVHQFPASRGRARPQMADTTLPRPAGWRTPPAWS